MGGANVASSVDVWVLGGRTGFGASTNAVGQIIEEWFSTTPWSESSVAALQASVLAKINQPALQTCATNTLAISTTGAEIWAAGTNTALQSQTSCVGNAVQVPWAITTGTPTCVTDAAIAPDTTLTMDKWTSTANSDLIQQNFITSSSTTFSTSAWMSSASGTATPTIIARCSAGTENACSCGTSDGSSVTTTPASPAATDCKCVFNAVTTTPIRGWASLGCTTAHTNPYFFWGPSNYLVSTGSANIWGAQLEASAYPTPYIATVGATATRNATTATVPLPSLHLTNKWCIGATVSPLSSVAQRVYLAAGAGAAANSLQITTNGTLFFDIYDSGGVQRRVSAATDWVGHRYVFCNNAGTQSVYRDGAALIAPTANSATWSATPSPMYLGSASNGTATIDGSISNVKVYNTTGTYKAGM